jgi:nicotinate phosphoribosyltransferase
VYRPPPLPAIRERVRGQLDRLHPGHKRFENPHVYPVGISPRLQGIREAMIESYRRQVNSGK